MKDIILAIETSCDETAAAVLFDDKIVTNIIHSQIKEHSKFGGVVPELASREHIKVISLVIEKAVDEAGINQNQITKICVTSEPGLIGSLMVGKTAAMTLAKVLEIPLININHVIGHAFSIYDHENIVFPYLCLVVSGGHTQFMLFKSYNEYSIIGKSTDDSIGESFDKVSKMMELGYPGGPIIEKLAQKGQDIVPMPKIKTDKYDFSFSGLKAHVKRIVETKEFSNEDVAKSFQTKAFNEVLNKLDLLIEDFKPKTIGAVGGVTANKYLRDELTKRNVLLAPQSLTTDNAAMIGLACYLQNKGL